MEVEEYRDFSTADIAAILWFIFGMIIKAMILKLHQDGQLGIVLSNGRTRCQADY